MLTSILLTSHTECLQPPRLPTESPSSLAQNSPARTAHTLQSLLSPCTNNLEHNTQDGAARASAQDTPLCSAAVTPYTLFNSLLSSILTSKLTAWPPNKPSSPSPALSPEPKQTHTAAKQRAQVVDYCAWTLAPMPQRCAGRNPDASHALHSLCWLPTPPPAQRWMHPAQQKKCMKLHAQTSRAKGSL